VQTAGLESLQENLQVPNHRIPLSARGVQESLHAGKVLHHLLEAAQDTQVEHAGQQQQHHASSNSSHMQQGGRLFMYTSPFLRCIQTAQHITRALDEEQVRPPQKQFRLQRRCHWPP
jgi:broad specificity phosphatase PhoE